jgi:hypothetical protein
MILFPQFHFVLILTICAGALAMRPRFARSGTDTRTVPLLAFTLPKRRVWPYPSGFV